MTGFPLGELDDIDVWQKARKMTPKQDTNYDYSVVNEEA